MVVFYDVKIIIFWNNVKVDDIQYPKCPLGLFKPSLAKDYIVIYEFGKPFLSTNNK